MQNHSPYVTPVSAEGRQTPGYLTTSREERSLFSSWYKIASPLPPEEGASFRERERFRRGRTGSQVFPALYLFLLVSLLTGFLGSNVSVVWIVGAGLLALIFATICNRAGMVNFAGFLVVVTFVATPVANIVTTPGGLNVTILPLYGLLILPLLCAVSFLPPWWVFVIAVGNSLFAFFSLLGLPQTAELNALLTANLAGFVTPVILSQLIVSLVAYLWVRSTVDALVRADRAEELAKLEHDLALQAEVAAAQKRQLEASVQRIIETHMAVASGDYSARVPLTQDNMLWQISGPLNNLLVRVQGWRQDSAELRQVKFALQQAYEENRRLTRTLRG
jgi:hypothetical protein